MADFNGAANLQCFPQLAHGSPAVTVRKSNHSSPECRVRWRRCENETILRRTRRHVIRARRRFIRETLHATSAARGNDVHFTAPDDAWFTEAR